MLGKRKSKVFLLLVLAALLAVLPACTPKAAPVVPTQAEVQQPTAVAAPTETTAPTATEVPPTATSEPTATPVPPTATPTNTPVPADQQLTGWCILRDKAMQVKASDDPATMPDGATPDKVEKGGLTVYKPAISCTFVLNLGQPAADGTQLEVLDAYGHPFLKANFNPSPKNPNLAYAVLTHPSIVEPGVWLTAYGLQVKSGDTVLWKGPLNVNNYWLPAKCWDGTWPNYIKLTCKKQQDLHPWDPAYTPPPGP